MKKCEELQKKKKKPFQNIFFSNFTCILVGSEQVVTDQERDLAFMG